MVFDVGLCKGVPGHRDLVGRTDYRAGVSGAVGVLQHHGDSRYGRNSRASGPARGWPTTGQDSQKRRTARTMVDGSDAYLVVSDPFCNQCGGELVNERPF